jgi:REP element-mobilizing transposase RayT
MSANRMHFPNTVHFITNRTEHEMLFLLPTERITEIVQCWFARALCRFGQGLEFYAFIFLSNHFHLLVNDTQGTLAAFMWYFQGNVAKAVNNELGRKGRFWSREYDDVIVDGDAALIDRYAYTMGNAVKAGLVDKSEEWLGWNSLKGVLSDGRYCFEMLNRTKLHNATRRGQKVDSSKFIEKWEFELTPPPFLEGKSWAEKNHFIEELMESVETQYRSMRNNKPSLGAKNILNQHHTDRPKSPAFRPRIKVFCLDKKQRIERLEGYRNFVGSYREIFDGFRKAASKRCCPTIEWPIGSYPPSGLYPISNESAG